MDGLERLLAIEEIKTLVGKRIRTLDTKQWDEYRACHAEDHLSFTFGEPIRGIDANMKALVAALDGVDSIHNVHSPEIHFTSDEAARGHWALEDRLYWKQGDEEHWLHGWGYYEDTYGLRDGRWLFTSRKVVRLRVEHSPGSDRRVG